MQTNILQFPQRNKGRVRKSESYGAMGETALRQFARADRPANVEALADHRDDDHDHGHLGLMLAATIFAVLEPTQKANLASQLRNIAVTDSRARATCRLLNI